MADDGRELARAFGDTVRELRKAKGLSQEGFADHVGVHRTFMGQVERAESVVSIHTANRIAAGLGLSLSELFGRVEPRLPTSGSAGRRVNRSPLSA